MEAVPNGYVKVIVFEAIVQLVGLVTKPPDTLLKVQDVVETSLK